MKPWHGQDSVVSAFSFASGAQTTNDEFGLPELQRVFPSVALVSIVVAAAAVAAAAAASVTATAGDPLLRVLQHHEYQGNSRRVFKSLSYQSEEEKEEEKEVVTATAAVVVVIVVERYRFCEPSVSFDFSRNGNLSKSVSLFPVRLDELGNKLRFARESSVLLSFCVPISTMHQRERRFQLDDATCDYYYSQSGIDIR
ncbi:hypothetical protein HZH68_011936 [Vespula germanica]|uniref:Uncharacterized protein n=1 Tax=Vespula germanica TaxID=30212 RepID=A0A834N050_VESGE|nr:hypothetical protein HZH68_011936 [Vespula germanica]